ncbi:MAG TPA: VCBS repeat-containing protein, partial [Acidimicrobiia bacterium]
MRTQAAVGALVIAASAVLVAPSAHATPAPRPSAARSLAPAGSVATSGGGRAIVGDFNGDGSSDLLVYTPGAGGDLLEYGTPFGFVRGPSVSVNGIYTPVVGDFNGDGRTDVLWYDPAHPGWHSPMWLGAASGFIHTQLFNPPSPNAVDVYTPLVGDFNGDGRDDIAWANVGPGRHGGTDGSPVWYGNPSGNFTASASPIPT